MPLALNEEVNIHFENHISLILVYYSRSPSADGR